MSNRMTPVQKRILARWQRDSTHSGERILNNVISTLAQEALEREGSMATDVLAHDIHMSLWNLRVALQDLLGTEDLLENERPTTTTAP